jgi:hypothetical protein
MLNRWELEDPETSETFTLARQHDFRIHFIHNAVYRDEGVWSMLCPVIIIYRSVCEDLGVSYGRMRVLFKLCRISARVLTIRQIADTVIRI